ncbi:MAG TPA: pyruvate kinase [Tepidisphaeraceae bacterium]|nr:pyruvate kinase [Tepidisphaeraceae bacterium]
MIRTKIVATMGPACGDVETLYRLFEAGADVCRLNFSHGNLDQHLLTLRNIREAAARFSRPIAVLGDLGGPKIRLGEVADAGGGAGGMPINVGDVLVIQRAPTVGRDGRVSTTYKHLVDDVQIGHRVFIEDGMLRFLCVEKNYSELRCTCTVGGILKTSKGINLPDSSVNVASITDKDWICADWAIENDLDYLALSFVRRPDDLTILRQHLANRGSDIQLIAKIEKAEALEQIDGIIDASDGLMVARGDLGVEMDVAQVPIIQKDLIRRCQAAGKPVIVATQMLQSMIEQASPTRAEVSDVANAIFDGTDAVMLSGETSVGKFPVGAVLIMSHIAQTTETYIASQPEAREPQLRLKTMALSSAVARGVWSMAEQLRARLVVVWSQTGATARIFSKTRFNISIIALSSDHRALRRMALHYGVIPHEMEPVEDVRALLRESDALVRQQAYAKAGDRVVVVAGSSMGTPGLLNGVLIHTLGASEPEHLSDGAPAMVQSEHLQPEIA